MEEISSLFCNDCQMTCNSLTSFKNHVKKRHPTKMQQLFPPKRGVQSRFSCDKCEENFNSARSLNIHKKLCMETEEAKSVGNTKPRLDDDTIACSDCELEFDDIVTFKQHMRDHRDNRIVKKKKRKNGPVMKQTKKKRNKSPDYETPNDRKEFNITETNSQDNETPIRKSRRSRKIISYAHLIESGSDSERETKVGEKRKKSDEKHVCKECNMTYDNISDLQKHTRKHHPSKLGKTNKSVKKIEHSNKKLHCEGCPALYNNKNNLRQHIRKYHPTIWLRLAPKLHQKIVRRSEKKYTCTECRTTYENIVGLRKHIRKYHTAGDSNSGKKTETIEKNVNCEDCLAEFSNTSTLRDHIKKLHPDKISILMPKVCKKTYVGVKRDITCSVCSAKYCDMSGLRKHTRKHHPNKLLELAPLLYTFKRNIAKNILLKRRNLKEIGFEDLIDCDLTDMDKYKCNVCNSSYSSISNLRKHLRKFHPDKLSDIAPLMKDNTNFKYPCGFCSKKFNCIRNFKYHQRKCHPEFAQPIRHTTKPTKINKCPLCQFENTERKKLLQHYKAEHDIEVTMNPVEVSTFEEFSKWKDTFEKDTNTRFVKEYHFSCTSHDVVSFICHRSGYYCPKGKGLRHMKAQGSSKINGYCPAAMRVKKMKDGTVKVTFCGTHIGHTTDVSHLNLTPTERQTIAEKIAQNIPFKEILKSMKDSASESDFKRIHMLSKKDLYNIKSSFHLTSPVVKAVKPPSENVTFEIWIEDMKKSGDCIMFHKPQGQLLDEHPNLRPEDFVLMIMNQTQRDKLRKFGHDTICIDRSFDLNSHHFELTSLSILNETEEGFPCVFLVSNRSDQDIMTLFFHYIKTNVGDINAKVFMSDMVDYFYNSWISIMSSDQLSFRYYCTWQIEHAWRKQLLSTMKSKEKQENVMVKLKKIFEEKNISSFKLALETTIDQLNGESHSWDFSKFLNENYVQNVELWPTNETSYIDIKYNSHFERLHKTLKHLFLNGKNSKHFGKALSDIMRFIKEKLFDRTILMNRGKINNKMKIAIFRHKLSLHSKTDAIVKIDEGWQVPCSDSGENYIITEIQPMCRCEFICPECKSCVHRYLCSCLDSTVKWNMCKHIHLLCRYLNSPEYLKQNIQPEEIITQLEPEETFDKEDISQQLLYLKPSQIRYLEQKPLQVEYIKEPTEQIEFVKSQAQHIKYIKQQPQHIEFIKHQPQGIEYIKQTEQQPQHIKYIKQQPQHIGFIKHQPQEIEFIKQTPQTEHVQIQHIQLENHVGHVDQVESAYIYCNETNQREMDAILAEVNICNLETVQVTQVTQIPTSCTIQIPTSCTVVPQVAQINSNVAQAFGEVVDTKESLKMKFLKLLEEASSPSELEVVQKMLASITPTMEVIKEGTSNHQVLFPL